MGGYGSGPGDRGVAKTCVEDCYTPNVDFLCREGVLPLGGVFREFSSGALCWREDGKTIASVSYRVRPQTEVKS